MNVLIIAEDPIKDQYMLKPIIEAMLETCNTCSILVHIWSLSGDRNTCVLCLSRRNGGEWRIRVSSRANSSRKGSRFIGKARPSDSLLFLANGESFSSFSRRNLRISDSVFILDADFCQVLLYNRLLTRYFISLCAFNNYI